MPTLTDMLLATGTRFIGLQCCCEARWPICHRVDAAERHPITRPPIIVTQYRHNLKGAPPGACLPSGQVDMRCSGDHKHNCSL